MKGGGLLLLVLSGLLACAESRRDRRDEPVADAALDASELRDAAAEGGGCPPTTSRSLIGHELFDAFRAAQRACGDRLALSTCDDAGVCAPAIEHCGLHELRLDDQGCATHYAGTYNFDALSAEISDCVVEEMALTCAPCDANETLTENESCTN